MFNSSTSSPSDSGHRRTRSSTQPHPPAHFPPSTVPATIPETNSVGTETYGHFPPAPEFYPVDPPVPPQRDQLVMLDLNQIPASLNALEDPSVLPEPKLPATNPSKKRPAVSAPANKQPSAKRAKKATNGVPDTSVEDGLQGLGPVPPPRSLSDDDDDDNDEDSFTYTRVLQGCHPRVPSKKVRSAYWQLVYPLQSEKQPEEYSLNDEAILRAKPATAYVGCRTCNQPSDDGSPSVVWKVWKNNGGVLSNIKRHFEAEHPTSSESTDSPNLSSLAAPVSTPSAAFDSEDFVEKIVTWIVSDDQAIRVVESEHFREMIMSLNPNISDKDIPHRTKIHNRILARYKQDREELKRQLKDSVGRISLTSDLWTDSTLTCYMAVTTHWIGRTRGGQLELKSALGAFRWIKDSHSGANIATHFIKVLKELDILDKIGGITMDNASNNNTAMEHLQADLADLGIQYVPQQQRIRCFAHVINLAVQDGSAALPKPGEFDLRHIRDPSLKAAWRDGQLDRPYLSALESDLVDRVQDLVRQLRSSGQRREALRETILSGNRAGRFSNPVPPLQLLRQVPTRWSSSYQMIDRFLQLSPAINLLLDTPNVTSLTRDDSLNIRETKVLNDIRYYFSYFDAVQQTLCGEKTPTLCFALVFFEELFGALKDLHYKYPKLMHAIHASLVKLEKYRQECKGSYIYTLAMVLHPGVKFEWVTDVWNEEEIAEAKAVTLRAMAMHEPRARRPTPPAMSTSTPSSSVLSEQRLNQNVNALRVMRANLKQRATSPRVENTSTQEPLSEEEQKQHVVEMELARYVSEPLHPASTDATFRDVLSYWKNHEQDYPHLFEIAMTVLAVPATSVPSERVFSSSGRTDTPTRNRMSPFMMEALQVLKFNHRNGVLDFRSAIVDNPKDLEAVTLDEVTDGDLSEAVRLAQNSA